MNFFEGFEVLSKRVAAADDVVLSEAWAVFLASPWPYIWGNPPGASGAMGGELAHRASNFLETAGKVERGALVELVWRMSAVLDSLAAGLGVDVAAPDGDDVYLGRLAEVYAAISAGGKNVDVTGMLFRWMVDDEVLKAACDAAFRAGALPAAAECEWHAGILVDDEGDCVLCLEDEATGD